VDEHDLNKLTLAAKSGDEDSFRVLVETFSRPLMALAFRYAGDWDQARDLTQDTWVKVYQKLTLWDESRPFSTWLYAIHRNGCLDHTRKAWVRRETQTEPESLEALAGTDRNDPSADLERREFHRQLLKAVGTLSESQRQVFLRVDLEGGDQKSVAEALGITFGTLRTTLHFARKRLAVVMGEWEGR
jgi:RNA polymerase sigma-70 factor (ECF subfamily)